MSPYTSTPTSQRLTKRIVTYRSKLVNGSTGSRDPSHGAVDDNRGGGVSGRACRKNAVAVALRTTDSAVSTEALDGMGMAMAMASSFGVHDDVVAPYGLE